MRPFDQAHPAVQLTLVDRGAPAATRTQPRATRALRKRRRALRIALMPAR
jgi:hypothetical protein